MVGVHTGSFGSTTLDCTWKLKIAVVTSKNRKFFVLFSFFIKQQDDTFKPYETNDN